MIITKVAVSNWHTLWQVGRGRGLISCDNAI